MSYITKIAIVFATCFFLSSCDTNNNVKNPPDTDEPIVAIISEFTASDLTMIEGDSATLSWSTENGASISISPNFDGLEPSGSIVVNPIVTTTYTLTVESSTGDVTEQSLTIEVNPIVEAIISEFTTSRLTLVEGDSATLSWRTENGMSVSISPDIEGLESSGTISVSPDVTTIYTLIVESSTGDIAEQSLTIEVSQLVTANIEVLNNSGYAPFSVTLTPDVTSQNAVNRYYWDFEGDGGSIDGGLGIEGNYGFDQVTSLLTGRLIDFDSTGRSQTYTYNSPGEYQVRLRILDADGNYLDTSAEIIVLNAAPIVSVSADKTTGTVPLTITYSLAIEDNEGVDNIRWDFESDGEIDQEGSGTATTHLFENAGTYQTTVEVIDSLGASTTVALPHMSIRPKPEGTNSVSLSASPLTGSAPLSVYFSSSFEAPSENPIIDWQWDLEGDGTVDFSGTENTLSYIYEKPGTYYPTLTVQSEDGDQATDIKEITVEPSLSLEISAPTFDPELEEMATITTSLQGTYDVQLEIVDSSGTLINTLIPWQERTTNVYQDQWDGTNSESEIAAPGPYFALLKYRVEGEERILDLRETTANQLLYPGGCSRGLRSCGSLTIPSNELEPFNYQPWVYEFTSNYIANFSSYMSIFTTNELMKTFFTRRPFGSQGTNQIVWNGDDTDGVILPKVSTRYLITILGETLGNNAMFLNHGVRLQDFRAAPSIYYPKRGDSALSVTLSRAASLELWVVNTNGGGEVFRTQTERLEAGDNIEFSWQGKNNQGVMLAPGRYRLSIKATDDYGYESQAISALQRISH